MDMDETYETRMLADMGYEIIHTAHIGGREILVAENMGAPDDQRYMKAEYVSYGLIGEYDRIIYTTSYLSVMEEYAACINYQIASVRDEIGRADYQRELFTAAQCYPNDYGQDITGEVVAVKPSSLRPEYRRGDAQLVFVTHGNGAKANPKGGSVFCYHLSDGAEARFERHHILGVVMDLPQWAEDRMGRYRAIRELEAPVRTAPENVAGYTITERVKVGNMLFVLGENYNAPSPYVTWQKREGQPGYELGHFLTDRNRAANDLRRRADDERQNLAQGKDRSRLHGYSHAR